MQSFWLDACNHATHRPFSNLMNTMNAVRSLYLYFITQTLVRPQLKPPLQRRRHHRLRRCCVRRLSHANALATCQGPSGSKSTIVDRTAVVFRCTYDPPRPLCAKLRVCPEPPTGLMLVGSVAGGLTWAFAREQRVPMYTVATNSSLHPAETSRLLANMWRWIAPAVFL